MKSLVMIVGFMLSFACVQAGTRVRHEGMTLRLIGIYTEKQVLYYRLAVRNHSRIPFYPDQPRFYIRDKKRIRRHAFQEIGQQPIQISGDMSPIEAGQQRVWVVTLPKAIPDKDQCLIIDLSERVDARRLKLKITCKQILKADFVNDL